MIQGLHRAEYDRFGGVGISMAKQSKLLPKHIHALLLRANDLRFGTVPHLFAQHTPCHWYLRNDADSSGNYFTTCSDGRLSFSTVTMVSAIWTVLEMTSVP
jgi:hypothetical protein